MMRLPGNSLARRAGSSGRERLMAEWREIANGWAVTFASGCAATILLTKRGDVCWNLAVSGRAPNLAEAQAVLEKLASDLRLAEGHAPDAEAGQDAKVEAGG